jgi:hypothetical protein
MSPLSKVEVSSTAYLVTNIEIIALSIRIPSEPLPVGVEAYRAGVATEILSPPEPAFIFIIETIGRHGKAILKGRLRQ